MARFGGPFLLERPNMATTVAQNPFDTQPPKTTSTQAQPTVASAAAPLQAKAIGSVQAKSAGGLVAAALPQSGQAMTYNPQTRQVDAGKETVQGQMDSILANDSPLMQRARTLATQQMSQRGLVNSSMAQGAGVAAMIDRAMPMAQQDANTYNAVASENMTAGNRANEFNAGQLNQFSLQKGSQDFQAGQADLDRAQQTNIAGMNIEAQRAQQLSQQNFQGQQAALDRQQQTALQMSQQEFQSAQQGIQNDFNMRLQQLQESGQDFRQARDIASRESLVKLEQMGIQNRFDQELALKSSQFNIEQYNRERLQIMQNQNELDKLGLQIKANNAQIPTSFAANISNTAMSGVNAILSDGNLSPDAKKAAIANLVQYANSQISWAERFYGTAIPRITTPV